MRINVVFGSESDKNVFEPLCEKLRMIPGVQVFFDVCSAHREPARLGKIIAENPCDLYIAGAGLAAHLPGVIASQTITPVIGVPCDDILQGQDALLSIVQMPKGVPVMSSSVNGIEAVCKFASWYAGHFQHAPTFCLHAPPWVTKQAAQLQDLLYSAGYQISDNNAYSLNLVLADLDAPPKTPDGAVLGVPMVRQTSFIGNLKAISDLMSMGGLWVGVNNVANLAIAVQKLWPKDQKKL